MLNHFLFFYLTQKLLVGLVFLRLVCFSKINQNWLFERLIFSVYFFVQFVSILLYKGDEKKTTFSLVTNLPIRTVLLFFTRPNSSS